MPENNYINITEEYIGEISLKKNEWVIQKVNQNAIDDITSYYQVPSFIASFIYTRRPEIAQKLDILQKYFFKPTIKELMPDPGSLKDMEKGLLTIKDAITNNKKIAIFTDYDVDGACSSALLYKFLRQLNVDTNNIKVRVGDRRKDGYGPSIRAMQELKDWGANLIISTDCGIVAFEAIDFARKLDCDFIVLDHHKSSEEMPNANAVINPNRVDENVDLKYLCGAGVVFMFCAGLSNLFPQKAKELKRYLLNSLDIVALATICDVVPLINLNRAFVKIGLQLIDQHKNKGISSILKRQNITDPIKSKDIGFRIGPLINACGRIGESSYGFKLLTSESEDEIEKIVTQMIEWNKQRIEIEREITQLAVEEVKNSNEVNNEPFIFSYKEDWEEGVIGIVASRIQEQTKKLSIIGTKIKHEDNKYYIKASCRSIPTIDIGIIVLEAVEKGLLCKGGGHKMVAGLTVELDFVDQFKDFLSERIKQITENSSRNKLYIDCKISPDSVNKNIAKSLDLLEPFGTKNESPIFLIEDIVIVRSKIVGTQHISVTLKNPISNFYFNAICFRSIDTDIGNMLINNTGTNIKIVCNIECQANSTYPPNIIILDAMIS